MSHAISSSRHADRGYSIVVEGARLGQVRDRGRERGIEMRAYLIAVALAAGVLVAAYGLAVLFLATFADRLP